MKDTLGDRMKSNYEDRSRVKLTRRTPVIIRLDGKAFHTLTRKCTKPFDQALQVSMTGTAQRLCEEIQGAKVAYTQSDEISILLIDYDKLATDAWFDYNIQKMVSVAASVASVEFTHRFGTEGLFDARAFNIPKEEVANYFVWRQKDWIRNSVSMLAQSLFSHKELHGKSQADMHEMMHKVDRNWDDLSPRWKNGVFVLKGFGGWGIVDDYEVTADRTIIERYLEPEE